MEKGVEQAVHLNSIDFAGDDHVVPFTIESLDVRGRAVQLGSALDTIISRHDYPEPVARLLGEVIVLTVLLGTSLKFDGQLILQTQSDGPVSLLVVDYRTPNAVRAYARYDSNALALAEERQETNPEELLGKGILALTIDQGAHTKRYQGMVALEGASLEEVAHSYFLQSEQIPTRVRLSVAEAYCSTDGITAGTRWRAGGLLMQFLPESEERIKQRDLPGGDGDAGDDLDIKEDCAWEEAQTLFSTIRDDEVTDPMIPCEKLLFRLFHEQGLRLFPAQKILDRCSCSSEKIWSVLKNMPENDLGELAEDDKISIKCEFCCEDYSLSLNELKS